MAYPRAWDNSAPPGSAQADTLDTIIQEFRQDTQVRISSLLAAGTTIDTDPLQLKSTAIGAVTGAIKTFNPFDLEALTGYTLFGNSGGFPVSYDIARAFPLPINARITRIRAYVNRGATSTCRVRILSVDPTSPAVTVVSDLGAAPSGFNTLDSGVFGSAYLLSNFRYIYVYLNGSIAAGGNVKFYGLQVTYDIAAGEFVP